MSVRSCCRRLIRPGPVFLLTGTLFGEAVAESPPSRHPTPFPLLAQIVQACDSRSPSINSNTRGGPVPVLDKTPVYREFQVDDPVTRVRWESPRYPDSLKRAKIPGEVVLEFVVNTRGCVVPGSERVLRATNSAFRQAVLATLQTARFSPATKDSVLVRQLVTQSFLFQQR